MSAISSPSGQVLSGRSLLLGEYGAFSERLPLDPDKLGSSADLVVILQDRLKLPASGGDAHWRPRLLAPLTLIHVRFPDANAEILGLSCPLDTWSEIAASTAVGRHRNLPCE